MPAPESRIAPDSLYHLVNPQQWREYRRGGEIVPASLADEGFIHCSWGRQVEGTLVKHFAGESEVMALRLDTTLLDAPIVEEDLHGSGQPFPHVYSAIPVTAVVEVVEVVELR